MISFFFVCMKRNQDGCNDQLHCMTGYGTMAGIHHVAGSGGPTAFSKCIKTL